jgi:predicted N-acetyltransferase YhbS
VGKALHETVLSRLREDRVQKVQLGGGLYRFWPGVPTNLQSAISFFEAVGWEFTDTSHDLVQDLSRYEADTSIYSSLLDRRISLGTATKADAPQVLDFVRQEFPSWLTAYQDVIARGDYHDILTAADASGNVVGLLIMYSPKSHKARADVVWHELLGHDVGALGTVGVAAARRGQGIGLALVARGSEILRERGVGQCHISWVVLLDFYGKLGYEPWRSYRMSWRTLDE